jgi:hypothetical protein
MYRSAFPDLRITFDEQVAEGDRVVTRWTCRGTHKGELMGVAPTGKQVTVTGSPHHASGPWQSGGGVGKLRRAGNDAADRCGSELAGKAA